MECFICGQKAQYTIKGTKTGYCEAHAKECFGDTSYLALIEDEAKRLKAFIQSK